MPKWWAFCGLDAKKAFFPSWLACFPFSASALFFRRDGLSFVICLFFFPCRRTVPGPLFFAAPDKRPKTQDTEKREEKEREPSEKTQSLSCVPIFLFFSFLLYMIFSDDGLSSRKKTRRLTCALYRPILFFFFPLSFHHHLGTVGRPNYA